MPQIVARHVFVDGVVQGVGFRMATCGTARELGVRGWVRNLRDRRVETWVEGERAAVDAMVAWLAHGPPGASVTQCDVVDAAPTGARDFDLRGDG